MMFSADNSSSTGEKSDELFHENNVAAVKSKNIKEKEEEEDGEDSASFCISKEDKKFLQGFSSSPIVVVEKKAHDVDDEATTALHNEEEEEERAAVVDKKCIQRRPVGKDIARQLMFFAKTSDEETQKCEIPSVGGNFAHDDDDNDAGALFRPPPQPKYYSHDADHNKVEEEDDENVSLSAMLQSLRRNTEKEQEEEEEGNNHQNNNNNPMGAQTTSTTTTTMQNLRSIFAPLDAATIEPQQRQKLFHEHLPSTTTSKSASNSLYGTNAVPLGAGMSVWDPHSTHASHNNTIHANEETTAMNPNYISDGWHASKEGGSFAAGKGSFQQKTTMKHNNNYSHNCNIGTAKASLRPTPAVLRHADPNASPSQSSQETNSSPPSAAVDEKKQKQQFGVFVQNLEGRTSQQDLYQIFFPMGAVDAVINNQSRMTGSRKSGIVLFSSAGASEIAALKFNNFVPHGQTQPLLVTAIPGPVTSNGTASLLAAFQKGGGDLEGGSQQLPPAAQTQVAGSSMTNAPSTSNQSQLTPPSSAASTNSPPALNTPPLHLPSSVSGSSSVTGGMGSFNVTSGASTKPIIPVPPTPPQLMGMFTKAGGGQFWNSGMGSVMDNVGKNSSTTASSRRIPSSLLLNNQTQAAQQQQSNLLGGSGGSSHFMTMPTTPGVQALQLILQHPTPSPDDILRTLLIYQHELPALMDILLTILRTSQQQGIRVLVDVLTLLSQRPHEKTVLQQGIGQKLMAALLSGSRGGSSSSSPSLAADRTERISCAIVTGHLFELGFIGGSPFAMAKKVLESRGGANCTDSELVDALVTLTSTWASRRSPDHAPDTTETEFRMLVHQFYALQQEKKENVHKKRPSASSTPDWSNNTNKNNYNNKNIFLGSWKAAGQDEIEEEGEEEEGRVFHPYGADQSQQLNNSNNKPNLSTAAEELSAVQSENGNLSKVNATRITGSGGGGLNNGSFSTWASSTTPNRENISAQSTPESNNNESNNNNQGGFSAAAMMKFMVPKTGEGTTNNSLLFPGTTTPSMTGTMCYDHKNTPPNNGEDWDTPSCTVYLSGIANTLSESRLRAIFQEFGEINKVRLYEKRNQGSFGFVEFTTPEAAQQLILQLDGTELEPGAVIRCSQARSCIHDSDPRDAIFTPENGKVRGCLFGVSPKPQNVGKRQPHHKHQNLSGW